MNTFVFNATALGYVPKVAQSFVNEHIRDTKAKDARIAALEALCASKDARIADLEKEFDVIKICYKDRDEENGALKAKVALLEKELEDSIAAHAGDAALDADKLAAQAKFAVANVEPYVRTDYEKCLFKANKHGLVKPMYKNVDPSKKAAAGNGEVVLDRNDLKECLTKKMAIYTMDNRVQGDLPNTPENRKRTYVPYAEIENDQKEFEKLYPKFTQHKDSTFKKVSRDPRCDKRALPRGRK
jgi:hypothetical protein